MPRSKLENGLGLGVTEELEVEEEEAEAATAEEYGSEAATGFDLLFLLNAESVLQRGAAGAEVEEKVVEL